MSSKLAVCVVAASGLAGAGYVLWKIYKQWQPPLPKQWRQVGMLDDLLLYPIKSCGVVVLTEAECTYMGLRSGWLRDRTLMVVDEKNNFITARAYPELLRVGVSCEGSRLTLSHEDMTPLSVELADLRGRFTATVWGVEVRVSDCGPKASEWFTRLLKRRADSAVRLVYYASESCRTVRVTATSSVFRFTKNDTGAFPDETSYHLISESSVADLNQRLSDVVVKSRTFRPNFVLKGAKAFEEDNWKFIRIGDNIFEIIKACDRCILTTIDPESATKFTGGEPLTTLKGYRQEKDPAIRRAVGSSPNMGIMLALRSPPGGRVKLNDPIYVPF